MPIDYPLLCIAAVGSMTMALKAEQVLKNAGVTAEVRPLSPRETRKGCAYGVAFPCEVQRAARIALQRARIPVSQYLKKDGTAP